MMSQLDYGGALDVLIEAAQAQRTRLTEMEQVFKDLRALDPASADTQRLIQLVKQWAWMANAQRIETGVWSNPDAFAVFREIERNLGVAILDEDTSEFIHAGELQASASPL